MRHTAWIFVLAAVALGSAPAALAENGEGEIPTPEQMERFERALGIRAREAELDHQQKLRELELEQRRIELDAQRAESGRLKRGPHGHHDKGGGLCLLVILVVHILLTIWVYKDMREQKIARALWVPIVLLAGFFGAVIYAIVRHADVQRAK